MPNIQLVYSFFFEHFFSPSSGGMSRNIFVRFFRYCWIELRELVLLLRTHKFQDFEKLSCTCCVYHHHSLRCCFFHFVCFKINWFSAALFYHSPEKKTCSVLCEIEQKPFINGFYISWWSIRALHLNSNSISYQFTRVWIIQWNSFSWILKNRVWFRGFIIKGCRQPYGVSVGMEVIFYGWQSVEMSFIHRITFIEVHSRWSLRCSQEGNLILKSKSSWSFIFFFFFWFVSNSLIQKFLWKSFQQKSFEP